MQIMTVFGLQWGLDIRTYVIEFKYLMNLEFLTLFNTSNGTLLDWNNSLAL